MKTMYLSICCLLIFSCYTLSAFSQQANNKRFNPEQSVLVTSTNPVSHDLKSAPLPDKSFYTRKSEWKHIIDTTWGPGASLEDKRQVFNVYSQNIHDKMDGLHSLKLDWDSLYNHYLKQITDSTSRGAFSAIMSRFAYEFNDRNTYAWDTHVIHTAPEPGVPILFTGKTLSVEHFGAVTTVLVDSTILVMRVAPNHPLDLEPGDIILGFEEVPWKDLERELFNAGLPIYGKNGGTASATTYHRLNAAGLNWHLFSSIDVLKYSTGETVHLSLEPMTGFKAPKMVNNEQLPVANVPFPKLLPFPHIPDTIIYYGIIENTNIGYIYLPQSYPVETVDKQFFEAVDSLKNTDALIIDIRYNTNGDAFLHKGLDLLFNESHKPMNDANRCDMNNFDLCPVGNWTYFQIYGTGQGYYDRPIAVLLGPSSMGMGDITAYRLKFHPMVRVFGASSGGSLGIGFSIGMKDWELNSSWSDIYYMNDPENFLNRKEFPVDFTVWFNKDDVAKGIDPIVEKAKDWISNLAYGHSLMVDESALKPVKDTIKVKATIENPEAHELLVRLIIESQDSTVKDSIEMKPFEADEEKDWQGIYDSKKLPENFYWLSVKVEDITLGTSFTNKHMARITTVPLSIDSLAVRKLADYRYSIQPYFKNEGDSIIVKQAITVTPEANPWVKSIKPAMAYGPTLKPGIEGRVEAFIFTCDTATFQNHFDLKFTVTSQGSAFWVLDTTITVINTSAEMLDLSPLTNHLEQNYPNPFNIQTTVKWQLGKAARATLSIYDILGRKVTTLVDEYKSAGRYETSIHASTLPKGIYFYQLKAGKFIQTRKMIVVK